MGYRSGIDEAEGWQYGVGVDAAGISRRALGDVKPSGTAAQQPISKGAGGAQRAVADNLGNFGVTATAAKRTLKDKLRFRDSTSTSRTYRYRLLGTHDPVLQLHLQQQRKRA